MGRAETEVPELRTRACPVCAETAALIVAESNLDPARLGPFAYASRKPPELMHHRMLECSRCSVVYASPAPVAAALADAYAGAAYDAAEESRYAAATYARLVRPLLARLPPGLVLDIGTGDGAFLAELERLGVAAVAGVEPSEAPRRAAPPEVRERIRPEVFDPAAFEPGECGLVTAFQTLEHVPDPLGLCSGARELLAPGGALVLVCHDRRAPLNRLLGMRSPIWDVEHLQVFCRSSLRALLERAGFERIELRGLTNRYPLRYWLRLSPLPPRPKAALARSLELTRLGAAPLALPAGNVAAVAFRGSARR